MTKVKLTTAYIMVGLLLPVLSALAWVAVILLIERRL